MLYYIAFAPTQKPDQIAGLAGLLFTHTNGDFGAISVRNRANPRRAAPISKVERHIYQISVHTIQASTKTNWYNMNIALKINRFQGNTYR